MQKHGPMLLARLRAAAAPLVGRQQGFRPYTAAANASLKETVNPNAESTHEPATDGPTTLHSVVSCRDGGNVFAAATVTFGDPDDVCTNSLGQTASHAAQVALLALRGALGSQRPPSALVALTSLELPQAAVRQVAQALSAQLGPDTAIIGCSSRLRQPDEWRAVLAAAAGEGAWVGPDRSPGPQLPPAGGPPHPTAHHITLAAAHLPGQEVHALRSETSSLPQLPHLAAALVGRRPPSFLMLAAGDSLASELMSRLENLFPGSCIGAGVAAHALHRDRRGVVLVGPQAAGGGSTRDGGAGSEGANSTTPGRDAAATGAGPGASDLEGPFQRMLLNREGSSPSSDAASTSGGTSGGVGRRRSPPASSAATSPATTAATATTTAAADTAALQPDTEAAAAPAPPSADPVASLPHLLVGDQVYTSGCALLALYPAAASNTTSSCATAAASPSAASPSASSAAAASPSAASPSAAINRGSPAESPASRLSVPSCDRLARVVLGTDQLHHVSLRGATLASIMPPPTGPETITAHPPAPDSPYYWWPATAGLTGLVQDPHLEPPSQEAAGREVCASPDQGQEPEARSRLTPQAPPPDRPVEAAASVRSAAITQELQGGGREQEGPTRQLEEEGEDEDEGSPSSAALAALHEGLVGLPLFPMEGALLFPGQTIVLRIFEKRYRLLMRACLEQGAAMGVCWRGMGTTAVVRSYQCHTGNASSFMVVLEGGVRFAYRGQDLGLLPASYGINVAKHAEYVVDEPPASQEDWEAMRSAAYAIMDGVAGALEAATAPPAQHAARTFANALHFASSQQPTAPPCRGSETEAGSEASSATTSAPPAASYEQSDEELLAEDLQEAKQALDPDTASLLSLYLAPHIPVHLESLRRQWFTTRNTLWRLQQEAAWMRGNQRVCLAVASSVLRLPREHPLRVMLGLSRVAAVV